MAVEEKREEETILLCTSDCEDCDYECVVSGRESLEEGTTWRQVDAGTVGEVTGSVKISDDAVFEDVTHYVELKR